MIGRVRLVLSVPQGTDIVLTVRKSSKKEIHNETEVKQQKCNRLMNLGISKQQHSYLRAKIYFKTRT